MSDDTLLAWEKWPVVALFIASGLYLAEWYAGARLAVPPSWMAWIATLGGLAAMVAVDGAMIATVAGMRAGRRGRASYAAILITSLFGGLVALVLHGALPAWVGAWLHAGFVATIAAYLLHLAQPRAVPASVRAELADARASLAHERDQVAELRGQLASERARPALTIEDAARLFIASGAPESTVRGWKQRALAGREDS